MSKDIIEKIVDNFGILKQTDMAIEEMSELTKALLKYRRSPNQETMDNIIEEVVDVQIMIEQIVVMYEINEIDLMKQLDLKINRMEERMKANE